MSDQAKAIQHGGSSHYTARAREKEITATGTGIGFFANGLARTSDAGGNRSDISAGIVPSAALPSYGLFRRELLIAARATRLAEQQNNFYRRIRTLETKNDSLELHDDFTA